jgi:hypothetical protein
MKKLKTIIKMSKPSKPVQRTIVVEEAVPVKFGRMAEVARQKAMEEMIVLLQGDPEFERETASYKAKMASLPLFEQSKLEKSYYDFLLERSKVVRSAKKIMEDEKARQRSMTRQAVIDIDPTCLTDYRNRPWIPRFDETYVAPPYRGKLDDSLIMMSNTIETKDGRVFYKVNDLFNVLMCSPYSARNSQSGDVLTAMDQFNKPQTFIVAYKLRGEGQPILVQDEELFKMEKAYFAAKRESIEKRVKSFLALPINNSKTLANVSGSLKTMLVKYIQSGLNSIGMDLLAEDAVSPDNMARLQEKIMETADPGTVGDLVKQYARIFIAIDPSIMGANARTILSKIGTDVLDMESLSQIDPEYLLEDILKNPKIRSSLPSDSIQAIITQLLNRMVNKIGERLFRELFPTVRQQANFEDIINKEVRQISPKTLLSFECSNKDIDPKMPDYLKSFYLDTQGMILYCFSTVAIHDRVINQKDLTNPYTSKQFDPAFIRELSMVNIDKAKKLLEDYQEASVPESSKMEIVPMENPYIQALIKFVVDLEKKLLSNVEPLPIPIEIKCEYCKHITKDGLKTIIPTEEDSIQVTFCNSNCMSDWSEPRVVVPKAVVQK